KYTVFLYKKKDLKKVIYYSEEGLKEFPDDRTLTNNYLAFFKNFINEDIEKKNYSNARKILNMATEKFPKDNYLLKMNRFLESIDY
ncbi:MAG: hypothetical protein KAT05_15380, partial [Spirochaetes bacterium]|nr:hypothetical protein [Spirochaetota bacterium]